MAEIKKDAAKIQDIEQTMKYVDWVKDEYCFGDYSMINAFLVAYDFDEDLTRHKQQVAVRKYTIGMKPAKSLEWRNLKLVKYSFDGSKEKLNFTIC